MPRLLLSSDGTVVVPPMEAVWLSGAEWELRGSRGCLSFEVKGASHGMGWQGMAWAASAASLMLPHRLAAAAVHEINMQKGGSG